MIAKFIRKEIYHNRLKVGRNGKRGETFPAPHAKNGSKYSPMVP
jgi:hypothetical protein